MKTHYAMSHNATFFECIPETRITTIKYTVFNASYRIKKILANFVEGFNWLLTRNVF